MTEHTNPAEEAGWAAWAYLLANRANWSEEQERERRHEELLARWPVVDGRAA